MNDVLLVVNTGPAAPTPSWRLPHFVQRVFKAIHISCSTVWELYHRRVCPLSFRVCLFIVRCKCVITECVLSVNQALLMWHYVSPSLLSWCVLSVKIVVVCVVCESGSSNVALYQSIVTVVVFWDVTSTTSVGDDWCVCWVPFTVVASCQYWHALGSLRLQCPHTYVQFTYTHHLLTHMPVHLSLIWLIMCLVGR